MGKKSAPAAPDYTAAAEAQGQSSKDVTNMQTWANRPELTTPWGRQTWGTEAAIDPATGQPVTKWTSNIELSPDQQQALDSQMRIQNGRSQGAETLLNQAVQGFQNPMDWNSLPQAYSFGPPGQNAIQPGSVAGPVQGGPMQDRVSMRPTQGQDRLVGGMQQRMASMPGATSGISSSGSIQHSFGTPEGFAQQAMDAVWQAQKPQLDQKRADTETQLSNMGLTRGSEAWNREASRLASEENAARLQAFQTGANYQNQLYGQAKGLAEFGNSAQNQSFGQGLSAAQLYNQAQNQNFGQAMQQAQFGQGYGDSLLNRQINAGNFQNQAQNQGFSQGMQNAGLYNQGQNQLFNQQSQAGQQNFQNQLQYGNYQNQLRQQAINEQMQRRGQTLNELNALLTGQQVNMPQMQSFSQAQRSDPTQYMTAAQNQYQGSLDAFNARQGQTAGLMNGVGSIASLFMMSDARKKTVLARVGELPSGIGMYLYEINGQREIGVLAQEVREVIPEAVRERPDGYLEVNYLGLH